MKNHTAMTTEQQVREMLPQADFGPLTVQEARLTLKEDGWHVELPILVRYRGNLYAHPMPLAEVLKPPSHVGVYEVGPLGSLCNSDMGAREARRVR